MKQIIAILLFTSISYVLCAKKYEVGNNKTYKTIKSALEKTQDGDTVYVYEGVYKEGNIIISKPVQLIGVNFPVLDGQKKYEILSIKASNTLVAGFKVQHSGFATLEDPGGIKIYNARNVVVRDNILDDNFFSIYLQHSSNCIVKNNRITAYGVEEQQIGNGIHCWKNDSLQIIGNTIIRP
jgi:nitrous oxidase accessory protein